jgi:ATP-dependent Clp protease ATP-binding subunit ClpX
MKEGSVCSIDKDVTCSFCGKTLAEAADRMIACSTGALICVECVDVCNEIIKEQWPDNPGETAQESQGS